VRGGLRLAVLGAICLTCVVLSLAQSQQSLDLELLNSERIEQTFGSYGIDVLSSDSTTRVSNLYSREGGRRICRTFAVAVYPREVDPAIRTEHAAILAGGSIGATFAASGWRVLKRNIYLGEIESTPKVRTLMGDIDANRLAVHIYELSVTKSRAEIGYASIVEIHHPSYLRIADLESIYGDADPARRAESAEVLLRLAAQRMR